MRTRKKIALMNTSITTLLTPRARASPYANACSQGTPTTLLLTATPPGITCSHLPLATVYVRNSVCSNASPAINRAPASAVSRRPSTQLLMRMHHLADAPATETRTAEAHACLQPPETPIVRLETSGSWFGSAHGQRLKRVLAHTVGHEAQAYRKMIWTPESDSITPETSPICVANVAFSKAGCIFPLSNKPRSPAL